MDLDFHAQQGRVCGVGRMLGTLDDLNRMHGLRLHPVNAPSARVNGFFRGGNVSDGSVPAVIADMG